MKHADKEDLLQLLTTHFLADVSTRAHLATPQQVNLFFIFVRKLEFTI